MAESESDNKRQPADDSEPEVYELNLDDQAEPAAEVDTPADATAHRQRDSVAASSDDGEGYELADEEPPRTAAKAAPTKPDPRLDRSAVPPAPPTASGAESGPPSGGAAGTSVPKQFQSEPDPAYVDPAVAASKREQARIRAAEQMALEDAKRRRTRTIILLVIAAAALLVLLWWMLLG